MAKVNGALLLRHDGKTYLFSPKDCEKAKMRAEICQTAAAAAAAGGVSMTNAIFHAAEERDTSHLTAWRYWRYFRDADAVDGSPGVNWMARRN